MYACVLCMYMCAFRLYLVFNLAAESSLQSNPSLAYTHAVACLNLSPKCVAARIVGAKALIRMKVFGEVRQFIQDGLPGE